MGIGGKSGSAGILESKGVGTKGPEAEEELVVA
jgi:hypothetical protein